ncbi:hypothetical protein GW17_00037606, partial [Ensete ventricosum]
SLCTTTSSRSRRISSWRNWFHHSRWLLLFRSVGIAFGTGSAIAHRAVDSVLGPRTIQHEMVAPPAPAATAAPVSSSVGSDACNTHSKAFQDVSALISLMFAENTKFDIMKCGFTYYGPWL